VHLSTSLARLDNVSKVYDNATALKHVDLEIHAGEGQTSGDIAGQLHLSEGTVRNYLSEAISKLGVSNRIEAARLAREKGWL